MKDTNSMRQLCSHRHALRAASRQRGIALMLVLWVLTLLTVMAVSMTATQRTELTLTEYQLTATRFRVASDAALAYSLWQLNQPLVTSESTESTAPSEPLIRDLSASDDDSSLPLSWLPDGQAHEWTFDDQPLTIRVFNELSRINLNQAPATQLKALLMVFAVPEDDASALAAAIIDWRDPDDLPQLNGAEDADYQAAGAAFGAKDEPFIAVDELRQVLGMTTALYQQLAPELTLMGDGQHLVTEFASAAVWAATQGISLEDGQFQQLNSSTRVQNRGGPLYRIVVTAAAARPEMPAAHRMEALLELTPTQTIPYVLHWRRFGGFDGVESSTELMTE